jgi:hypothetical protein
MDPKTLIFKYKEYVHGNRHEMRRVVLDASMLSDVLAAGDIRIESPNELLSTFLGTVRTEMPNRGSKPATSPHLNIRTWS